MRRGLAHLGMGRAVLELEELHRELDVGEPALAELEMELRVFARRDPLALDACLDAADLARGVGRERVAVDERLDHRKEARPRGRGRPRPARARSSDWNSHVSAQRS